MTLLHGTQDMTVGENIQICKTGLAKQHCLNALLSEAEDSQPSRVAQTQFCQPFCRQRMVRLDMANAPWEIIKSR